MLDMMGWNRSITFLVALIFSSGGICTALKARAATFGVWSEWESYPQVTSRLPRLGEKRVRLHLAIKRDEFQSEARRSELESLLRAASVIGVEVWAWPLLLREQGYWLNQWNAGTYSSFVHELVAWTKDRGLSIAGVSMDLEPPPEKLEELLDAARHGRLGRLRAAAARNRDPALLQAAKTSIRRLAEELRGGMLQVHAVTTPLLIAKAQDGDVAAAALGIPFDPDAYDFISFMAYRSEYQRIVGPMNSRMVYDTAIKARELYGAKASIDLGVVGNIEFPHPLAGYVDPSELWKDIAAARAGGMERIQVYCLDGMDDRAWLEDRTPKVPGFSIKNTLLESFFGFFLSRLRADSG